MAWYFAVLHAGEEGREGRRYPRGNARRGGAARQKSEDESIIRVRRESKFQLSQLREHDQTCDKDSTLPHPFARSTFLQVCLLTCASVARDTHGLSYRRGRGGGGRGQRYLRVMSASRVVSALIGAR